MHINRAIHLRERKRQIAVHHVSEHAADRKALRVLFAQEPHHAIFHVACGKRAPCSTGMDIKTLAFVGDVAFALLVHQSGDIDLSFTEFRTARVRSERFVLVGHEVTNPPDDRVVRKQVDKVDGDGVFLRLPGKKRHASRPEVKDAAQ